MNYMNCKDCDAQIGWLTQNNGRCLKCHNEHIRKVHEESRLALMTPEARKREEQKIVAEKQRKAKERAEAEELERLTRNMIVTTETAHNLPVHERMGIVTAEAVLGMNVIKDVLADLSGTFGGRSKTMQKGLKDARDICLTELKAEAVKLGADAVVGVDLDYNDFGTSGRMLAVIATGTAVKLESVNA